MKAPKKQMKSQKKKKKMKSKIFKTQNLRAQSMSVSDIVRVR